MTYTTEQREAIKRRGQVIVSASAGSGKTFVMINRLVELILGGADVNGVLALTFTNKAAAQMRERLRTALINKLSETEGEERSRIKGQLNQLPLAEIGTIHSFCAKLARTYFYLLGEEGLPDLAPAFRIISPDDAEGQSLATRATDEVFERCYEEGGEEFFSLLSVYFRKKKDRRLRELVHGLYQSVRGYADYRLLLERMGEDNFSKASELLYSDYLRRIKAIAGRVEGVAPVLKGNKKAATVCEDILRIAARLIGSGGLFSLTEAARAGDVISSMPPTTKAEGELRRALFTLSQCSKAIKEILDELRKFAPEEVERERSQDACRRAGALAKLTLAYDEVYTRLKREANVVDYNDLEHYALSILSHKEAREELRARFCYLFVDEYQDVNPVQEEILSLVSGEEVFLVGDAKQAIYGFRGSSSAYFERKEKEMQSSLRLTGNFRSGEEILAAVNATFAPLYPGYADMTGTGEERGFVRVHLVKKEKTEKAEEGARGVYSVLTGGGKSDMDPLSEEIARIVSEEKEKGNAQEYGDIAVLVRKNSGDAERIVRALAKRGIPVTASSKVNVLDYFEGRLFLDWLSYLDNAEQDIPLVTALLSALGGFTDSELAKIRLRFPSAYTFREACKSYAEKMADSTAKKLARFYEYTEGLRRFMRVCSAGEMLERLFAEGLEAQVAAKPEGQARLARVRRLIAEAGSSRTVREFLARLQATNYRVDFAESGGTGAVKVFTMHASKGLEFPVVILSSLDCSFHGAERDELLFTKELLFTPRSYDEENKLVYETVQRRAANALQREEELKQEQNLFYVGMTRACKRLHLVMNEREREPFPEAAKKFSDFLPDAVVERYVNAEEKEEELSPPRMASATSRSGEEYYEKIKELITRRYPYAESCTLPVKSSATELIHASPKQGVRGARGFSAETGTAYHAFLEHVRVGEALESELTRMRESGLLSEEQLQALDFNKLQAILHLPSVSLLDSEKVYREQTFLVRLQADEAYDTDATDEILFQGAIDALVQTKDGWLILDYKFSSGNEEYLRAHYGVQISLYRKAVARILRVDERKIRARIVNIAQCFEVEM